MTVPEQAVEAATKAISEKRGCPHAPPCSFCDETDGCGDMARVAIAAALPLVGVERSDRDAIARVLDLVIELAQAVDAVAEDVGTGPRTPLVILRELVQATEKAQALLPKHAGQPVEGWSDEERHAVGHARYQVERATPDNSEVGFDYTLVATLLKLIERLSPAPASPQPREGKA